MIVAFSAQFFFGSSCAEARSTDTFDIRRAMIRQLTPADPEL